MFYYQVLELILIIILTLIESFSKGNEKVLFTTSYESGYYDIISVPNIIRDGNGLAFCSWILSTAPYTIYFDAERTAKKGFGLEGELDFKTGEIYSFVSFEDNYYETIAYDCNLIKSTFVWFHICVSSDQSSITFYYNGYPVQNYTKREKFPKIPKQEVFRFNIGSMDDYITTWVRFFQTNIYNRPITAEEAKDMSNCKFIEGDLLSWNDIISESDKIEFDKYAYLEESVENETFFLTSAPCPIRSPYHPVNCETGEPFQNPTEITAGSKGNDMSTLSDSGSSSKFSNPGASPVSSNPTSSPGSSNPTSSPGSSNPTSSPGSSNPTSSPGSSNPTSSPGSSNPTSSPGSSTPTSSSENSYPTSSPGSSNPTSSSENSYQTSSPGSSNPTSKAISVPTPN